MPHISQLTWAQPTSSLQEPKPRKVDLHGLHVREAEVRSLRAWGYRGEIQWCSSLSICTIFFPGSWSIGSRKGSALGGWQSQNQTSHCDLVWKCSLIFTIPITLHLFTCYFLPLPDCFKYGCTVWSLQCREIACASWWWGEAEQGSLGSVWGIPPEKTMKLAWCQIKEFGSEFRSEEQLSSTFSGNQGSEISERGKGGREVVGQWWRGYDRLTTLIHTLYSVPYSPSLLVYPPLLSQLWLCHHI